MEDTDGPKEISRQQEFPLANGRDVLLEPSGGTIVERCATL